MNEALVTAILAIVQGITEWFPISSSAHLVLVSKLLSMQPSFMVEVALHLGTLMAVFVYFGKDIVDIIKEMLSLRFQSEHGKLGVLVLIATLPAALVGMVMQDVVEQTSSHLGLIALGFLVTSMMLFLGSLDLQKRKPLNAWGAFAIGCSQVLSLFRGVSRSGSTISTGLLLGLKEKEAIKFSFLLSIPVILGANVLTLGNATLPPSLLWATLVSFAVGLCVIHVSFQYVLSKRKNLRWFALYTLLLALVVGGVFVLG